MIRRSSLTALLLAGACAAPRPTPPAKPRTPAAAAPATAARAAPVTPAPPAAERGPDRSRPPERGPVPELTLPAQRHFALANGMKVRLVEYRRLPVVALHLVVNAGASLDPEGQPGLASFAAAMLTEGTKTRSAVRISDEVGFLGASVSAGAGVDAAFLSGSTLARHLPKLLELYADVAMNPAFPKGDFARVQDQRLVTLLQQRDQPQTIASKAFADVFWGSHPYGHFSLGTEESVKAMTPADLARFHARNWRPANAELVVVGDVSEAELRPMLERTFGSWRRGEPAPAPASKPPAAPHRTVLIDKPDAPQTIVLLGMPGIGRASPDFVAATVGFQVLGGGTSSRLFRNLREDKGYTYGIGASEDARRLGGASVVRGSVKTEVTGAALSELLAELAKLRDVPVGDAELADAKAALVLSLPADFATAGGIAGRVAELVLFGLPDGYWNDYADAVGRTSSADVLRVAKAVLDPARATLVLVGAPAAVAPQLSALPFGKVELRPAPGPSPKAGSPATGPRPAAGPASAPASGAAPAASGAR